MTAPADHARIIELRAQGLTTAVISDRTGVHISSVKKVLAEAQFGRITPEIGARIESMRAEGHSQVAIAAALQLSQSQVSEYLTAKHKARFTQGHFAPTQKPPIATSTNAKTMLACVDPSMSVLPPIVDGDGASERNGDEGDDADNCVNLDHAASNAARHSSTECATNATPLLARTSSRNAR